MRLQLKGTSSILPSAHWTSESALIMAILLFAVLLLTTLDISKAISVGVTPIDLRISHLHENRQILSSVPSQCEPDCDPINDQIQASCTTSKCCTANFETGYFTCLKCVGTAIKIEDYSSAQNVLDTLFKQCAAQGVILPKLTLPGQDPDRPMPTDHATAGPIPQSSSPAVKTTETVASAAPPASIPAPAQSQSMKSDADPGPTNLPDSNAAPPPSQTGSNDATLKKDIGLFVLLGSVVMSWLGQRMFTSV